MYRAHHEVSVSFFAPTLMAENELINFTWDTLGVQNELINSHGILWVFKDRGKKLK
jgi:hypothetical protein